MLGWNGCLESASQALQALAACVRHPQESSGPISAEHLVALAAELDKTRRELLTDLFNKHQALSQEVLAWRLKHPYEQFEVGAGIVKKPVPEN